VSSIFGECWPFFRLPLGLSPPPPPAGKMKPVFRCDFFVSGVPLDEEVEFFSPDWESALFFTFPPCKHGRSWAQSQPYPQDTKPSSFFFQGQSVASGSSKLFFPRSMTWGCFTQFSSGNGTTGKFI